MPSRIHEILNAASAIAKGMSVTLEEMFSPPVTEGYPDKPPGFEERFRGLHVLQRDENGRARISAGERYAAVYNIDYNRCIFCGFGVEACPTDAITHGHGFELASYDAVSLVYRKERLLAPLPEAAEAAAGARKTA